MNREIKFRGYDRIADCWCFGVPVKDQDVKGRWWIMFNEKDGAIIDDPKSIGEYTGRHDLKNKKCFDGDIFLDQNGKKWIVSWDDARSSFMAGQCPNEYQKSLPLWQLEIGKIIGNIHQSPELLKNDQ